MQGNWFGGWKLLLWKFGVKMFWYVYLLLERGVWVKYLVKDVSEEGRKHSRQPVVSREGVIHGWLRGKLFLEGT